MAYEETTPTESTTNTSPDKGKKTISVEISTLFSQDNSSKSVLKISLWNGKLGFDFSKTEEGKLKRQFITMDYEKSIFITGILTSIVRDRITNYKNGSPYSDFVIPIENSYAKDGELHKLGTLYIKTVPVKSEVSGQMISRVALSYEAVGEKYDVVLSSRLISKQITDKFALKEIDPDDARLFLLVKTLDSVINNLPVIAYLAKLADIILTPHQKFEGKPSYKQIGHDGDRREYSSSPAFEPRNARTDDVKTVDF